MLFETLDNMAKGHRKDLRASDVATKDVISVKSTDTVRVASELMRTTGISQLPVLNGEQSVGSISEKIIFDRIRDGRSMDEIKDLPVSEVMDDSFPMVAESTPVSAVTSMMNDSNAVLVTRKGRITGLITKADILKLL